MEQGNSNALGRFQSFWGRLTTTQQIMAAGGLVAALALIFYLSLGAQTPDYATLFTGLDEQDAAAVVEQLKADGVTYRLLQGGTTIQVPARQVHEVRLQMAQQGLPKGKTVGFELFDGGQLTSMGMTDFMQRVSYQRALEGELGRTIGSLESVVAARVHIVVPEQSLFISEEKEPTASIVLQLDPRNPMTREQVRAVTHLVASSVEGLRPGNITLVDVAGNVLAAAGEGQGESSSYQVSSSQFEIERSYERELETRLSAMLSEALGNNRSIVRVTAAFNWDQKLVNSETYVPAGEGAGLIRSQQEQEELYEGSGAIAGGVPGVDSNTVPGYPAGVLTGGDSSYNRKNTVINYELSKIEQTVVHAPGKLERLTVAVLLDESVPGDQATRLQGMLTAAAGLDPNRGDSLVVERIPFIEPASALQATPIEEIERRTMLMNLARLAALLLALLIIMRFARKTFRELSNRMAGDRVPYIRDVREELMAATPLGSIPASSSVREFSPEDVQRLRDMEGQMQPRGDRGEDQKAKPQMSSKSVVEEALRQVEAKRPEIVPLLDENPWKEPLKELADSQPELLADLIEQWIGEGGR